MKTCDLIMKGGVTSGVVYPQAIREIARQYRLCSVGGTSAGALAAVLAAAAEYRRAKSAGRSDEGGFDRIVELSRELAENLKSLFQPSPKFARLFRLATDLIDARNRGKLPSRLFREFVSLFAIDWLIAAIGTAAVMGGIYLLSPFAASLLPVLTAIAGLVGIRVVLLARRLYVLVLKELPAHDFGMCSGLGSGKDADRVLVNWLDAAIQTVAGGDREDGQPSSPLTVGGLREHGIELAAMTTDLSSGRPYQLPLQTRIHYFSKREFERLFPAHIVAYLVGESAALTDNLGDAPRDLYQLPVGDDFPVLLLARMSLSFPVLFQTVPLYRRDYQLDGKPLRRCLFSDGGLSSNFPVHFFDSLLPSRPTFGISLGDYAAERHGTSRFHLPERAPQSTSLPVRPPRSVPQFFGAMFNTSRTWSDTLQSMLPSYAERTVEVRLTSDQGGLNLTMDKPVIKDLIKLGGEAGSELVAKFDFDEHRYLRAVAMLPVMEGALEKLADNYEFRSDETSLSYAEILTTHPPKSFKNSARWREAVLARLANELATIGAKARDDDNVRAGDVPVSDAEIRYVADADRVPKSTGS